ncbi:unnamed protein product [Phytophthora lilii]|uniref:Elicitin n=1 Tax=Phytophthora lilii TaxID=2077276 RepID=A0A9W6TRF3_9STRA|nr:unnamed protein product [Phytophthora lilii]
MRVSASVTALGLVLVVGVVNSDDACSTSDLIRIAASPNVAGCSKAAGFNSISTISDLTPEQINAICESSACVALIKDIAAMGLGDC